METNRSNKPENNQHQKLMDTSSKQKRKQKTYYGKFLVFVILLVLLIEYYIYVFEIMLNNITKNNYKLIITLLFIFHILLSMLLWSFFITMNTNPGEIPIYWGFYIGDDDNKRKRYCLICNAFKPERAHHCSICNTCILNMDHHCPWVNNCIGFYNRKFFMQLLFYVCFLTVYFDITLFYFIYKIIINLINDKFNYMNFIHYSLVIICYLVILIFTFIINIFFKFHIELVLKNSTTIESLDIEHKNEYEKFNLNIKENWYQVFGFNKLFWFIPYRDRRGAPDGDGLSWKTKDNTLSETNIEMGRVDSMKDKIFVKKDNKNYSTGVNSFNDYNSRLSGKNTNKS